MNELRKESVSTESSAVQSFRLLSQGSQYFVHDCASAVFEMIGYYFPRKNGPIFRNFSFFVILILFDFQM